MAKAVRQCIAPVIRVEDYAEPAEIRRPPYFAEVEPAVLLAAAELTGDSKLAADADQYRPMKISGKPLSALDWLIRAVTRLKAGSDCPKRVTDVARMLEHEMAAAFRAAWKWGSIKNTLLDLEYWPRTRPPRR